MLNLLHSEDVLECIVCKTRQMASWRNCMSAYISFVICPRKPCDSFFFSMSLHIFWCYNEPKEKQWHTYHGVLNSCKVSSLHFFMRREEWPKWTKTQMHLFCVPDCRDPTTATHHVRERDYDGSKLWLHCQALQDI